MGKDESMQEVDSLAAQSANGAHQSATGEVFTREQLALIRDEWLAPLVDEIRHQAQDIANLEVLYRQVVDERDRLAIERDELLEQLEALTAEEEPEPPATGLERLNILGRQLRSAEGAVVAAIAIALALWLVIGLSMFIALS